MSLIRISTGMNQTHAPQAWHESLSNFASVACICAVVCYGLWLFGGAS